MATAVGSGLAEKELEVPDAAGGASTAELDENQMETASIISGLSAYTVGTQGTGMSAGTLGKPPSTVGGRGPRKSRQKVTPKPLPHATKERSEGTTLYHNSPA